MKSRVLSRFVYFKTSESIRLIPSWRSGLFGVDAAGEALLPDQGARLAPDDVRRMAGGPARGGAPARRLTRMARD